MFPQTEKKAYGKRQLPFVFQQTKMENGSLISMMATNKWLTTIGVSGNLPIYDIE
jgi:hypothetical protein